MFVPVHGAGAVSVGSVFTFAFTFAGVQEVEICGLVVVLLWGFGLHGGNSFAVDVSTVDVESSVFGDRSMIVDRSKVLDSSFDFGRTP